MAAIDAGAFPEVSKEKNGGWWDRRSGRLPTFDGAGPVNAPQFALTWTVALGSWLARAFPHRFRDEAAKWDWSHIARDAEGYPIGKDGKRVISRWYKNGKLLKRKPQRPLPPGDYECRDSGPVARVSDFYDESDWLEQLRIRAEIYSDACLLLSDLIDSDLPVEQLVTLSQVAPLTGRVKRTLERYLKRGDIPTPDVPGVGGGAHQWYWSTLRPALVKIGLRKIPIRFPASRII